MTIGGRFVTIPSNRIESTNRLLACEIDIKSCRIDMKGTIRHDSTRFDRIVKTKDESTRIGCIGQPLKFQLASGATCNQLPAKYQMIGTKKLTPTRKWLTMYNDTLIKPLGKCTMEVLNFNFNFNFIKHS